MLLLTVLEKNQKHFNLEDIDEVNTYEDLFYVDGKLHKTNSESILMILELSKKNNHKIIINNFPTML